MFPKLLRKGGIALIWLGIWTAAAAYVNQQLLLPSPLATAAALIALAQRGSFWLSCLLSVTRIFTGYALGITLGCILAVLTSRYTWWREFFSPLLSMIKATPVASFILLALVWLRVNGVPTFATVLVVLPVTWANVSTAITATDASLLEMARAFRMPWQSVLRRIYWPSVQPALRAAVTTGMGMAWKAGVAAEIICTPRNALGSILYSSKIYLDMPTLFAGTAVVILLSIALEKMVVYLCYGPRGRRRRDA